MEWLSETVSHRGDISDINLSCYISLEWRTGVVVDVHYNNRRLFVISCVFLYRRVVIHAMYLPIFFKGASLTQG